MRLIDADALKEQVCLDGDCTKCKTGVNEKVCKWNTVQLNDVIERLESAPTIDAVPVVRCKDCEHWDKSEEEYSICCHAYHNMMMVKSDGTGYCSDAERKDDDKNEGNYE